MLLLMEVRLLRKTWKMKRMMKTMMSKQKRCTRLAICVCTETTCSSTYHCLHSVLCDEHTNTKWFQGTKMNILFHCFDEKFVPFAKKKNENRFRTEVWYNCHIVSPMNLFKQIQFARKRFWKSVLWQVVLSNVYEQNGIIGKKWLKGLQSPSCTRFNNFQCLRTWERLSSIYNTSST